MTATRAITIRCPNTVSKTAGALRPPVERLKAIRCLIYQCSEGKVPDSKLYKELEVMSGRLANVIVQNTHEYDGAPWGF